MAGYTEVEEYTNYYPGDLVEAVTVRKTDDPKYPSGWDYSLHFGSLGGDLIVRFDNAHEPTKGRERHTADGIEEIEFPGMFDLLARFQREVTNYRNTRPATRDSEVR
ncbi:DUF6516 family protein [Halorussus salilacus]|uniref:toxin-antitoxin system TumE family protein n=1 Tax=Halorussus salilacus TaxID=2953750 RepID=UPI0020A21110|nr:DUF6516 family protein [Halorussus salilacus]USZ67501.1 DUF6516 family protein [Halorussus salilacus]